MEARALKKSIRMSPRKMRLVIDLIRNKKAGEALTMLHFHPKYAAAEAKMVLLSAIANLTQKASQEGIRLKDEDIVIKKATVDNGAMFYRTLPASHGRVYRIRRRSNHLTIVVGTTEKEVNA
jgi:large subunit ribosomal protein L22